MRKQVWLLATLIAAMGAAPAKPKVTFNPVYEVAGTARPANQIDRLVFSKFPELDVNPMLCSDAVFVRRVFLDVIGTLPTAVEARQFIRDPDTKNKRAALIEKLLAREEFADYWSMKWGDILRIKAEFPVNLWPNAAQAYHHWVRASIIANKPYDKMVREMLTSSGSNFRVAPVNFYRAVQNRTPEGIALAVALTFMGERADMWPKERLAGMAVFFSEIGYKPTREWKEENVFWDPLGTAAAAEAEREKKEKAAEKPAEKPGVKGKPAAAPEPKPELKPIAPKPPKTALFPDGTKIQLPNRDPREVFADWLIRPENPRFARCAVNRVWAWLLGRGIVHEPDDFREENPPSNPALLAYLEKEFIASGYDLKKLYRLILNSNTYQLSSMPRYRSAKAEAAFACYPLRRLDAEVLADALNKVTGTTDLYTSAIPEPFTYIPKDLPAIAIADGSITSSFLTLFGRSARATGMENERVNKPMPSQWLHMLNSSQVQGKLEQGPKIRAILDAGKKPNEVVELLYLTILSRFPTPEEIQVAEEYTSTASPSAQNKPAPTGKAAPQGKYAKSGSGSKYSSKRRDDWIDLTWALINSTEFLYRH